MEALSAVGVGLLDGTKLGCAGCFLGSFGGELDFAVVVAEDVALYLVFVHFLIVLTDIVLRRRVQLY